MGQVGAGLVPYYGQAADVRDTAAGVNNVWNNPGSGAAWAGLGGAVVGWVPLAGDALKGAIRGGLTAAGRSLTKHGAGARPGNTLFPPAKGSASAINQTAQSVADEILTTPGSTIKNGYKGRFGPTIEVTAPGGRGLVYDASGNFLFFKE